MGNSCLEYKKRYKFVTDFEVEVVANAIVYYLEYFMTSNNRKMPGFSAVKFKKKWQEALTEPVNGAINLHLDELFSEDGHCRFLIELTNFAKVKFIGGKDTVSETWLNEIFSYEVELKDGSIPAKSVEEYFDKFVDFLRNDKV